MQMQRRIFVDHYQGDNVGLAAVLNHHLQAGDPIYSCNRFRYLVWDLVVLRFPRPGEDGYFLPPGLDS